MLELIEETLAYYSNPNRRAILPSIMGGAAVYLTPDGKQDPCYRCMNEAAKEKYATSNDSITNIHHKEGDSIFQPKYQGVPTPIWQALQSLHDRDHFWNLTGLNEQGKEYINNIITKLKKGLIPTVAWT